MPVLRLPGAARRPGLLLDAGRRPTSAALLGLGMLVLLAFVVAFVLGTSAQPAAVRPPAPATAAGSAMTSLRLDPVPALPDLRGGPAAATPAPAQPAAPPAATTAAPTATTVTPTTVTPTIPTPAATQPVQPPVTPSRPAPTPKPKPRPSPAGQPFDSSG
jgi:hypothetical protein